MRVSLCGSAGALWEASPAMALVLLASMPCGATRFCDLRNNLLKIIPAPNSPKPGFFVSPTVQHVQGEFHRYPTPLIYVGHGSTDIQGRPAQWANPYHFICSNPVESGTLFRQYLDTRADLVQYLAPLRGFETYLRLQPWAVLPCFDACGIRGVDFSC